MPRHWKLALPLMTVFLLSAHGALAVTRDLKLTLKIEDEAGKPVRSFTMPVADSFGGASVAVGDLGRDGVPEIVIANGLGGEPRVHALRRDGTQIGSFLAYDKSFGFGVNVAICDLDGDGLNEIVTAPQRGGGPQVRAFSNVGKPIASFWAYPQDMTAGVAVACRALTSGTVLATQPLTGGTGDLQLWRLDDKTRALVAAKNLTAADTDALRALVAQPNTSATGDLDQNGMAERVVVPGRPPDDQSLAMDPRTIVVDLSEQRLYAYEYGILTNTFLVSTAKAPYKTPLGTRPIMAKVLYVHYAGGVGKDAYDLGVVKYNLRFADHIYLHYAPWHNLFGTPISHGCVNINLSHVQWLYGWAQARDPVIVRE